MKVKVVMNDGTVMEPIRSSTVIVPQRVHTERNRTLKVKVVTQEIDAKSPLEKSIDNIRSAKDTGVEERPVKVNMNDAIKAAEDAIMAGQTKKDDEPKAEEKTEEPQTPTEPVTPATADTTVQNYLIPDVQPSITTDTAPDVSDLIKPEGEDIPRGIFKREVNDGADLGKLFRRR